MSFDVFYQPMRFTESHSESGTPKTIISSESLNASDLQAVKKVLEEATVRGPSENGCYVVEFEDGGRAEVYASELAAGCMTALRGITPNLLRFLFDLLNAGGGNWVMLPAMEGCMAITNSPKPVSGLPEDFPRLVICNSPEELGVLITDGVAAWQELVARIRGNKG